MDNETKANIKSINKALFQEYPDLISVEDLQKILHISRPYAYELIKNKKVRALKIGRSYKITKNSVIELFFRSEEPE